MRKYTRAADGTRRHEVIDAGTDEIERANDGVLEIASDRMVVQVLGGTRGLDVASTTVLVRVIVRVDFHKPTPVQVVGVNSPLKSA